jgi:hypothetical protein
MLHLIDRLAGRWLDWRTDRKVRKNPDLQDFKVHSLDVTGKSVELVASTHAVAMMADQAATFLNENDAENYVQFDMMPRLDRGLRPIRVTVQWANGLSPAVRAAKLAAEVEEYRQRLADAGLPEDL